MKKHVLVLALSFYLSFVFAGEGFEYVIVQEESQASFSIFEVLLGNDKIVEGVTSKVEGTIHFDPASPQEASLSAITIDATDLTTDDNRRNRQIQRRVLNTRKKVMRPLPFR